MREIQKRNVMAYFDKNRSFETGRTPSSQPISARFSPLEWAVILSAKRDSLESLEAPGRLARAFGGVLGLGIISERPDDRLETLRHLAVRTWRHTSVPVDELSDFLDAGFSPEHLSTLQLSIAAASTPEGLRS